MNAEEHHVATLKRSSWVWFLVAFVALAMSLIGDPTALVFVLAPLGVGVLASHLFVLKRDLGASPTAEAVGSVLFGVLVMGMSMFAMVLFWVVVGALFWSGL